MLPDVGFELSGFATGTGDSKVQIAAILTLAARTGSESDSTNSSRGESRRRKRFLTNVPDAKLEVLGKSLLDRNISRLREAGVESTGVIPEGSALTQLLPTRSNTSNDSISVWEKAIGEYVRQGVDTLLLLRTSTYIDLDYEELLRFHSERRAGLTQVYSADSSVDAAVVNANLLRESDSAYRTTLSDLIPDQEHFYYQGYINRLRKPQDFRRLTEDALTGKCNLCPVGTEVGDGIWFGDGVEVDETCLISGPAFIGAGTRIAACTSISGSSAVERNCEIDCSTAVDQSWILQETYVGLGLTVRGSIVSNQKMFNLDRKTELPINDPRLIRATKSFSLYGAGSMLLKKLQLSEAAVTNNL
jgi:NDP-sugar pyrophosphorylase family protein